MLRAGYGLKTEPTQTTQIIGTCKRMLENHIFVLI